MEVTATGSPGRRNPGPSWGYRFLELADRVLPEAVFRPLRAAGTWIAVLSMPVERGYSREYLRAVLGRDAGAGDVFRHFFSVCEALMLRLRVGAGRPHLCTLEPGADDFAAWLAHEHSILIGTFHIGDSDLAGFMLAGQERRRVRLVRLRVGNSRDTDALASRFGDLLTFVWVNEPSELLFALKEAGASGETVALQCDRREHSARTETFKFLGAARVFPFTIYYLSLIFSRPVLLTFAVPERPGRSTIVASPAFVPRPGEPRDAALARARAHFQAFLARVEDHLRSHPYQWLNFLPL